MPEKAVPITPGCEKTEGIPSRRDEGLLETQEFLLRDLHIDLLIQKLTHLGFKCKTSSLKNTRNIQGGTKIEKLYGKGWWSRGQGNSLLNGSASRHHCSFVEVSFYPTRLMQVDVKSQITINLANTICSALVIPRPCSTHLAHLAELFQQLFHTSSLPRLQLWSFLKSLKD